MHRELLSHPYIGSYSAFLLFALVAGFLLLRWRCVRMGIDGAKIDTLMLFVAGFSLLGARFFSWWFYFPAGAPIWDAFTTRGAGLVFYGGLIFGIATVIVYAQVRRLPLRELLDACAPALALGLAIGRVGCFLGGCCWGDVCLPAGELTKSAHGSHSHEVVNAWQLQTAPLFSGAGLPWAVEFPPETGPYRQHQRLGLIPSGAEHALPVHPVQLYEALLAAILAGALHFGFHRRRWPGQIACALTLGYAVIRFVTEFFRADNAPVYAGLTLSQVISIALAAGAIICCLFVRMARARASGALAQPVTIRKLESAMGHETQG